MKILSLLAAVVIVVIIILLLQGPGPDQTEDSVPAGQGYSGNSSGSEYQTGPGPSGNPGNFQADRLSGPAPLTIRFTDRSGGSTDAWFWDFGDGETSREENPVHTFFSPGTYHVTLTAVTDGRNSEKSMTVTVTTPALQASFTASPTSGTGPLEVDFTERSSGSPTSWSWSFGDGATSTLRHPTHMYANPGIYRVILVVERDGLTDTKSTTITVHEQAASTASSFTVPATSPPTTPPLVMATVKATAVPTTEGKPVPTTKTACSYYSYTINGRTVSGTCCGSLSSSMQCSGGVCRQTYTCNGVPIG